MRRCCSPSTMPAPGSPGSARPGRAPRRSPPRSAPLRSAAVPRAGLSPPRDVAAVGAGTTSGSSAAVPLRFPAAPGRGRAGLRLRAAPKGSRQAPALGSAPGPVPSPGPGAPGAGPVPPAAGRLPGAAGCGVGAAAVLGAVCRDPPRGCRVNDPGTQGWGRRAGVPVPCAPGDGGRRWGVPGGPGCGAPRGGSQGPACAGMGAGCEVLVPGERLGPVRAGAAEDGW